MNIFEELKQQINKIAQSQFNFKANQNQLSVELPKDPSHGDLSTNIAMIIAKPLGKAPIEIAKIIKAELEKIAYVESVTIAGPGFINLNLKIDIWHQILSSILEQGIEFGDNNMGNGEAINIEFVSTNPTGPMHIGHSRGGIYGDSLANLMTKSGYKVTKEFYINDAGAQIDTLGKSVYLRYLEASGEKIDSIPEGLYPGDYLIPVGEALFKEHGDSLKSMDDAARMTIIKSFSVASMMELIKKDLKLLGVEYDVFFSEKTLHEQGKITEVVEDLKKRDIVYNGTLPMPKGKAPDDWEAREQLLIRSTEFGDDVDRSLQKSNGDWTYAAADIAYMKNKLERGFKKITIVLGADHQGYKKRMQAIVHALAGNEVDFQIQFYQVVNFLKNGQPFKMSKRKGTFITVEDVLDEVNKDLVRFVMLTRRNDQILDFDLEKVKEQSKDNPVFYVQYANARVNSILNSAGEQNPQYLKKSGDFSLLKRAEELRLIKLMASWPKIIELACIHQEPHRVAFYLIELASEFHSFWSRGNEDSSLRFIIADDFETSLARLNLAKAVNIVISSGLKIFNVVPINKM
jgi:arginyl-tRNA synthetase